MSTPNEVEVPSSIGSRFWSFVALALLLVGATILTVGVMLAFGVPAGLIVLGGITLGLGLLLGLVT